MYSFPAWRLAPLIGVSFRAFGMAHALATAQGSATIRLAALTSPSNIGHLNISISSIQLHQEGFLNWTTISQTFPTVDLVSPSTQSTPQTIISPPVPSCRYDSIKIFFTNSTVSIGGQNQAVAAPHSINTNTTLLVAPNGVGDLLLVVAFDYASLYETPPSLSFVLVSV